MKGIPSEENNNDDAISIIACKKIDKFVNL